jgi:hypothetical protein
MEDVGRPAPGSGKALSAFFRDHPLTQDQTPVGKPSIRLQNRAACAVFGVSR